MKRYFWAATYCLSMIWFTACQKEQNVDNIDVLNCNKTDAKCWKITYTASDGYETQTQEAYEWGTEYDKAFKLKNISAAAKKLGKNIHCTMQEDKNTDQDACSAKARSVNVNQAYKKLIDSWNMQI